MEAEWDGGYKAPKGLFRVIGEDTFPTPHEEYFVGDYEDLESAKDAVKEEDGPMTCVTVFDDHGQELSI